MKTLSTPRLTLRPFEIEDAADVFAYAQNPNVGAPAGWPAHQNLEESERIVRAFIQSGNEWAVVLKETGRVIGSLGLAQDILRRHERARSVGYVLAEPYWNQGYMTEAVGAAIDYAFEELGVQVISAVHYPYNKRSGRVMEKCGLRYEGTLRQASKLFDGSVQDNVCYSLLREEWLARRG